MTKESTVEKKEELEALQTGKAADSSEQSKVQRLDAQVGPLTSKTRDIQQDIDHLHKVWLAAAHTPVQW